MALAVPGELIEAVIQDWHASEGECQWSRCQAKARAAAASARSLRIMNRRGWLSAVLPLSTARAWRATPEIRTKPICYSAECPLHGPLSSRAGTPPEAMAKGAAAQAKAKAAATGKVKARAMAPSMGGRALPERALGAAWPPPMATWRWVHYGGDADFYDYKVALVVPCELIEAVMQDASEAARGCLLVEVIGVPRQLSLQDFPWITYHEQKRPFAGRAFAVNSACVACNAQDTCKTRLLV